MKKLLRISLVAMLAIFGLGNAMAEDIIWQEDWTGWTAKIDPNTDSKCPSNYSFTGTTFQDDGVTYKGGTGCYNEGSAGGEAPEMLIAKNGGSFTATISLGSKSGNMFLAFKCNKNITVTVTGGTLGEVEKTSNDYVYPITGASGTLTIKFENNLTSNARLDNIKLYQGTAKKPAGLSWGKSSASVTLGDPDDTYKYIPTLQNPNNLSVSCTSSDTNVATVANDGTVTVKGAGETKITASFAGNSEYEAAEVSFTLTVKEPASEAKVIDATVAEALAVINGLEDGAKTTDQYKVTGYVVGAPDFQRNKDNNELYGNVNLEIADEAGGTTTLTIFRARKDADMNKFTEDDLNMIKEGDKVVFQGVLQKFVQNDVMTPELSNGYLVSVTSGIHAVTIDDANAPAYSLDGRRVNSNYRGVVIKNGKKVMMK